jgi:hypothetical protein
MVLVACRELSRCGKHICIVVFLIAIRNRACKDLDKQRAESNEHVPVVRQCASKQELTVILESLCSSTHFYKDSSREDRFSDRHGHGVKFKKSFSRISDLRSRVSRHRTITELVTEFQISDTMKLKRPFVFSRYDVQ